jgi:putative SOS response-associated peptidase YedK
VEALLHPSPRYNVAPSQEMPVLVHGASGLEGRRFRWGLVPFWADDPSIGNRLINARSETAHQKPSFRNAFRRGRCLVPADGFYEWRKGPGGKIPFWIHMEAGEVFTFAGLSERWSDPDGGTLETFTILTTDANELLEPIHPRMPVILPAESRRAWLDADAEEEDLRGLLRPAPSSGLAVREVSTRVNSPANDDPSCLDPPGPAGSDLPLFRDDG